MEIVKGTGPRRRVAIIGRDDRGDWTIEAGRENDRRFRATVPLTGREADDWMAAGRPAEAHFTSDRVVRLATRIITHGRHKLTEPKAQPATGFAYLDGEERVELHAITKHCVVGEMEVVAAWVSCSSPRCQDTVIQTDEDTHEEVGRYQRPWRRLVVWFPDRPETDPRTKPMYAGGVKAQSTDIEGRDPYEVKGEHIAWHRETFGVHPRVRLDWWLMRNPGFGWAEVDREEVDRQLSIAKDEQREQAADKLFGGARR